MVFSKTLTSLLVLALSFTFTAAQEGPLNNGVYRLSNTGVTTGSSAWADEPGENVFIVGSLENPGSFDLWDVQSSGNSAADCTIRNVGLTWYAAYDSENNVITSEAPSVFAIRPFNEFGEFTISHPEEDLLWAATSSFGRNDVVLKVPDGDHLQRWAFVPN